MIERVEAIRAAAHELSAYQEQTSGIAHAQMACIGRALSVIADALGESDSALADALTKSAREAFAKATGAG